MNISLKNIAIKGIALTAAIALSTGLFCGCEKDKKDNDGTKPGATAGTTNNETPGATDVSRSYYDYDLSYMSLGKYKGVEIKKDLTVQEKEIRQSYFDDLKSLSSFNKKDDKGNTVEADIYKKYTAMQEKERAVKDGDLIYFDYSGFLDGKAFDGGTAKNQELLIGSGNFIPGFEEAVIGHTPGSECSIDVTFPKDYHAADLAGKAVIFKITIHYIYPEMTEASVDLLEEAYKLKFEEEASKSSEEKTYKPSFTDVASYKT